jgi:hypothetical protein
MPTIFAGNDTENLMPKIAFVLLAPQYGSSAAPKAR